MPLTEYNTYVLPANSNIMGNITILADREHNWQIPSKYTCDGDDEFPTLTLKNVPTNAKSLALIVDDPDAPVWVRDHYIIANLPNLGTEFDITTDLEWKATLGRNGRWDTRRWWPCPPNWEHRYFFKIYALDTKLVLKKWFRKSELLKSMEGHVIWTGELIGNYKRIQNR